MHPRIPSCGSFLGLVLFGLAGATSALSQVGTTPVPTTTGSPSTPLITTGTAQLVEFDISSFYNGGVDAQPGAVAVDKKGYSSGVWFVTRAVDFRVIRLQPDKLTKTGMAQWNSWKLDGSGFTTGGLKRLKPSDDGRFVFVRTVNSIQAVDTGSCGPTSFIDPNTGVPATGTGCTLLEYQDDNTAMISDLALDNQRNLYTAISFDPSAPVNSYIERLNPNNGVVTRWQVGGGAGNCVGTGANNLCLAGIAVAPKNSNLVYYSEPDGNNIGELNVSTNTVRRWSLSALNSDLGPVFQPRQLNIDQDGIVWVVTGSGDLVSLDPQRNLLTRHQLPDMAGSDPFGVAPDGGFVGYTATDTSKVAMLVPRGTSVYVCPSSAGVPPICKQIPVARMTALQDCGQVPPQPKTVTAQITSKQDGTYVEAIINSNNDSSMPLGITPHPWKGVGTFFYAVGATSSGTVDRVGFARLPRAHMKARHEREDKDSNDDGSNQDDEDHDGIPNRNETNDSTAHVDRQNDQLGPGQSTSYTLTAGPNTKALVASITADNPLAPVSIEIDDPNGIALALPLATPGTAVATAIPTTPGDYTVRVTNAGPTAITHETQLLAREPLSLF